VDEFVEECQREWERLGVPPSVAEDLTARLEAAIEAAGAGDTVPATIAGHSTRDVQAFAGTWARTRPAARPRLQYTGGGANRLTLRSGVIVLLVLFAIGGVAAVLEIRSPSEQESRSNQNTTTAVDLVAVPDLLGLSSSAATAAAQAAGVRIGDTTTEVRPGTPSGTVLHQVPDIGTKIPRGNTLTLVVAK
jgi:PASTA domain